MIRPGLLALTLLGLPSAPPVTPIPTLFGPKPEVYVSPTMGPQGTPVRVVGLGFRPGLHVSISALDLDAGCYKVCPSVATAIAGPHGLFRARFVVHYPTGQPLTPLVVDVQDRAAHFLANTTFLLESGS